MQKESWSGDYKLTVLNEAIQKIYTRFGLNSTNELVSAYPNKIKYRLKLEQILSDIGLENLGFPKLRNKDEDCFSQLYDLKPSTKDDSNSKSQDKSKEKSGENSGTRKSSGNSNKKSAHSNTDPKSVMKFLRGFKPKGDNREKLVALINEAKILKLDKHPYAFCFILRVMFELSAKAYCKDNEKNGCKEYKDNKSLEENLKKIASHLNNQSQDKEMVKKLHGAMTELSKKTGLLSVTSMNQLVHNPRFSVDQVHICTVFHNVFPLLEEMNN